ncbi:MAG: tRNA pseudouridine(13) synthase TruD [Candidatus Micrarchaeia archaeon]
MWAFRSRTPGIGGRIKEAPEDFVVEEITREGKVLEEGKRVKKNGSGEFTRFVLQKRNWNTEQALAEMARRLGVGRRRFSCAGTKDRVAVSTQLCSVWGVEPEKLVGMRLKDIDILGAWKGEKVGVGELLGNRFRIVVRGTGKNALEKTRAIDDELGGLFPNYFGAQRFGALRGNTHLVGRELVKGNLRAAVLNYLCFQGEEEDAAAREARKTLSAENDFARALSYFPRHLKYERALLHRLASNPRDWAGALRALPRGLLLMFVHAYQAWLFNLALSQRISEGEVRREGGEYFCGEGSMGFPEIEKKSARGKFIVGKVIGFDTKPNEREKSILEQEGVGAADFRIRSLPEASSRGARRVVLAPYTGFAAEEGKGMVEFRFSLPAGCYATSLLREFMSEEKA